jgi:hypothetical protein
MIINPSYVLPVKVFTEEELQEEFSESNYNKGLQCLHCDAFKEIDSDHGVCWRKDSIFKNRVVFEHFSCKKYKSLKDEIVRRTSKTTIELNMIDIVREEELRKDTSIVSNYIDVLSKFLSKRIRVTVKEI